MRFFIKLYQFSAFINEVLNESNDDFHKGNSLLGDIEFSNDSEGNKSKRYYFFGVWLFLATLEKN